MHVDPNDQNSNRRLADLERSASIHFRQCTDLASSSESRMAFHQSVSVQGSGLVFARRLPFRQWEKIGQQILGVANSSTWWTADWLAYGEHTFGDRYREAMQKTSLNYQTLRNYVWVARRFDLSRRRDNLSFGHHAEVASLEHAEQDYWLRKAEELSWTRNRLRAEVRASLRERQTDAPARQVADTAAACEANDDDHAMTGYRPVGENLSLWLSADRACRLRCAAALAERSLGEWALDVLDAAASEIATEAN